MEDAIRVKVERKEGGLIAQCLDNPAIIVTGTNKSEIRKNPKTAVTGYAYAFPESKREFFHKGKMHTAILIDA